MISNRKIKREQRNRIRTIERVTIVFITLFGLLALHNMSYGQFSTVEYLKGIDNSESPTATSVLTDRQVTGRFGTVSSGGFFSPTPDKNSRFTSGAIFNKSGGFIGLSTSSPNSRFQPITPNETFQSGIDYSLYRDFVALKQQEAIPVNAPRQVQAQPQTSLADEPRRSNPPYYASGQYRRDFGPAPGQQPAGQPTVEPFRQTGTRQQAWMRNPPDTRTGNPVYQPQSDNVSGTGSATGQMPVQTGTDLGSRMVGNLYSVPPAGIVSTAENASRSEIGVSLPPVQQQNPTTALQEYLELLLLRSPNVNPLSPIQVTFNNGTATVQGIVPSQAHRMEAGRILLTDPRVKKVDNKLTILPTKTTDPLPPVFDPNLEKK